MEDPDGADALFAECNTVLAALVHPSYVDLNGDLRAVFFYKDDAKTKIRPLGVGESRRRLICRCLVRREREKWAVFFTSELPEDKEEREQRVAEAAQDLAEAEQRRDAASVIADADVAFQARDEVDDARARLDAAKQVPNFPTNWCFSSMGTEKTIATVQAWCDCNPKEPICSGDMENFYNLHERESTFHALKHCEFSRPYVPCYRLWYSKPAKIFVAPCAGEFTHALPASAADDADGLIRAPASAGDWHDASLLSQLYDAGAALDKVVLWLVESSGGIERGALRHLNLIAKRITGNKGSDRTKYGTHPLAPKSFVPHHMQRLSVAAVKGDAKGVRAAANKLKRKVMGNAASAAAVGARA